MSLPVYTIPKIALCCMYTLRLFPDVRKILCFLHCVPVPAIVLKIILFMMMASVDRFRKGNDRPVCAIKCIQQFISRGISQET